MIRVGKLANKLTAKWKGPYIVEKKIDDITYREKRTSKQQSSMYHVDRLALYQGRNIPTWAARFRTICGAAEYLYQWFMSRR